MENKTLSATFPVFRSGYEDYHEIYIEREIMQKLFNAKILSKELSNEEFKEYTGENSSTCYSAIFYVE